MVVGKSQRLQNGLRAPGAGWKRLHWNEQSFAEAVGVAAPDPPSPHLQAHKQGWKRDRMPRTHSSRAVLQNPNFFFLLRTALKDSTPRSTNCQPPTATNSQPPPTANGQRPTAANSQPQFMWFCVLPMT